MLDFQNPHLYINIVLSLLNAAMLCFVAYKFFQTIQLGGYRIRGYFNWLNSTKGNYLLRLFMLSFLSIMCMLVTNTVFISYTNSDYFAYLGLIFYVMFSVVFIRFVYNQPDKVPLKYTHRMNRYIIVFYVLSALLTFWTNVLFFEFTNVFKYSFICFTPLCVPVIVIFVHFLTMPLEYFIRLSYISQCKKKLKNQPNLKVIAITGSYGKTSTKFILTSMLSQKYNVLATPNSFNTPMGITKTVNNFLTPEHEILVAEFGANAIYDIKALCNIAKPDVSILTNIGKQHLATFRTFENLKRTKLEIFEFMKKDGTAVFNMDDENIKTYAKTFKGNKIIVSANENCDVKITDVKTLKDGSVFTLNYNGESKVIKTKLLGEHNIQNIFLCACVALNFGVTLHEIANAVENLKPTKHRLELIKGSNGVTILDDSFNANIEGFKQALNVLKKFEGKKVLLTPGIIELGNEQAQANYNVGVISAEVCDKVIIVNKTNQAEIEHGLIDAGFNTDNIHFYNTLLEAQLDFPKLLSAGDVLLIENDLPDNYV